MRFAILTLASACATASAALIARQGGLPPCALQCIATANFGNCTPDDTACLCNTPAFISSTTACIESTCTGNDLQTALTDSQESCASVGVTLTSSVPLSTGSTSSTKSGSTSATPTSPSSPASSTSTTPATSSSPAPSPTTSTSSAMTHGVNAVVGLAAIGLVALVL